MKKDAGATRDWQATRRDLIYLFGVTTRTTSKWEDEGMPVAVRGGPGVASLYDLREVIAWIQRRDKGSSGTIDLTRERARKERATAKLSEQRFQERAGELIPGELVLERWGKHVSAVRQKLLSWPPILAARLAPLRGQAVVRELELAVRDVLTELATLDDDEPTEKPKRVTKKKVTKKKARG